MTKRRAASTLAACLGVLLGLSVVAAAAEQTRETYTEAVEPICKANTEASDKALSSVKGLVKAGKLDPAAAGFEKAAGSLKKALAQLRAVPPPGGDQARLAKWLGYVKTEQQLFEAAAAKLRAGKKGAAIAMTVKLTRAATEANNEVVPFGFRYCHADTAKYS